MAQYHRLSALFPYPYQVPAMIMVTLPSPMPASCGNVGYGTKQVLAVGAKSKGHVSGVNKGIGVTSTDLSHRQKAS